jgi:DNA polymerase-3 subunit delta'
VRAGAHAQDPVTALEGIDAHPHARALLMPVIEGSVRPSHAYLFHGPAGTGKRSIARAFAAALLAEGAGDPVAVAARVQRGTHPDLTWVVASGATEMLVADIEQPVVAAAARTPFEAARRVFVIEAAHTLNEQAANRMLKTLEEPPAFVHLILITDRVAEVLPTIRSRCQLVRFDARGPNETAAELETLGVDADTALACARLALGDAGLARELASPDGALLRAAAERYARAVLAGQASSVRPWAELLSAVRARGEATRAELDAAAAAEVELYPRKERKRIETEWGDRARRVRRRTETAALDLGLQLVGLWFGDLLCLAWQADELIRHSDRHTQLDADAGRDPSRLRAAIELVEDTRVRFQLNVSEELACEALAYRLERALSQ